MKVLFIGNSHTYVNDMPRIFRDAAEADGVKLDVTMVSHPGWFLDQHIEWPEVRFNILFGNYDYVVVQEHAHPFGPEEKYFHAVGIIADFVKQTSAKLVIYSTWAPKNDLGIQGRMSMAHREVAEKFGALRAPVDDNWSKSLAEHPEIDLYASDGQHASLAGSTLAAKTIWNTIKEDLK